MGVPSATAAAAVRVGRPTPGSVTSSSRGGFFMRSWKPACIACLLALGTIGEAKALIVAGPIPADFTVTTFSMVDITAPIFAYDPQGYPGSASPPIPWAQPMADIPSFANGGGPNVQGFVQAIPPNPGSFTQYSTMVGLYTNPDTGLPGVILMLDHNFATNAVLGGLSWDSLFNSSPNTAQDYSEATIAGAVQGRDMATILAFFEAYLPAFPIWQLSDAPIGPGGPSFVLNGDVIGFSNASPQGAVIGNLAPVPEPSALALVGVGGLILGGSARRRRRRGG